MGYITAYYTDMVTKVIKRLQKPLFMQYFATLVCKKGSDFGQTKSLKNAFSQRKVAKSNTYGSWSPDGLLPNAMAICGYLRP
jgi:hypothetical protein